MKLNLSSNLSKTTKRFGILMIVVLALALVAGVVNAQPGDGRGGGRGGRGGQWDGEGRGGVLGRELRELVQIVADQTGLTVEEITDQVQAGASLADVITANGGSVDEVKSLAIADTTERINQAVTKGRITQERADELLANLDTVVTAALNRNPAEMQAIRMVVMRVAGETGLKVGVVMQQWQDGTTLSQILTDSGEDVQTFIDETIVRAEELLTQAVANGRLTQAQADARLATFTEDLPNLLTQAFPEDLLPFEGLRGEGRGLEQGI